MDEGLCFGDDPGVQGILGVLRGIGGPHPIQLCVGDKEVIGVPKGNQDALEDVPDPGIGVLKGLRP
jgi:hypothetical protein